MNDQQGSHPPPGKGLRRTQTKKKKSTPRKAQRKGTDDTAGGDSGRRFPIVGIGASVGALAALKSLFRAMPPETAMAYVVVMHLDPDHQSHMTELLSKSTDLDVVTVEEGMRALPHRVHIIPPDRTLTIRDGVLHLSASMPRATRYPIDEFFKSLAVDQKERAIAVVLTGTGSDGSRGAREIKAEGGLLLAQDPSRSEHPGMPRAVIATGLVDRVASLEELPQVLVDYVKHARLETDWTRLEQADAELKSILALLKNRGNFDFSWYKRSTVVRRIRRRMGLTRNSTLSAYLAYLRADAEEVACLVDDLLIGVTAFFREPEAWRRLADAVLPRIVAEGDVDAPIRVWVPACSTGEEAYTLAILLVEELERQNSGRRLQIFATDVDDNALEVARAGLYPQRVLAALDPQRVQRFFTPEGEQYRAGKVLRESLVFAQQNIISDSPFSRLDLISCRNMLIYLESAQQQRVLSMFHFVLRNDGYLFLGSSETIGKNSGMFTAVSKKWRIYRRVGAQRRPPVDLPFPRTNPTYGANDLMRSAPARRFSATELGRSMLLQYCAPAAVLVDRNADVLYFHGATDRYLTHPQGEPTTNLLDLARRGLRGRLRAAIHRANLKRERVVIDELHTQADGTHTTSRVTVIPWMSDADPSASEFTLVTFEDVHSGRESDAAPIDRDDGAALAQLEDELKRTKEELQSTIEELETANEELKVSNEEAMSMNEELQSTNEELETSKEELQSLNEELITINNQLEEKITEVQQTTDDLDNLLLSSNVATLFLDRQFRVKRFTPAVTRLLRLIGSDIGRHISDITSHVRDNSLLEDASKVLETLRVFEKEVQTEDAWYIRRVLPYRTQDHRIEGVVITYADITESKRRSEEHAHLASVVSTTDDAVITKDRDGVILTWNRGAERVYGFASSEMVGQSVETIIPEDRKEEWHEIMHGVRKGQNVRRMETQRLRKDGARIDVALSISPVIADDGRPLFFSSIARDITDIKTAQREVLRLNRDLQQRLEELQALVDVVPVGISIAADPQCDRISINPAGAQMLGAKLGDNVSLSAKDGSHVRYEVLQNGRTVAPDQLPLQKAAREGVMVRDQEYELVLADGRKLDILMSAAPLTDDSGRPRGAVGVFMNIGERKRVEERLQQQAAQLVEADRRKDTFLAVLGHELRNPLAPIRNVVDLLQHHPDPGGDTLKRSLGVVSRQVTQLTRLVDDLLDVARIAHDDIQLQHERFDLVELCNRLAAETDALVKQRSQSLRYAPPPHDLAIFADPVRIEQVISNLLHNASNYTPEGGHIWLSLSLDGDDVVIKVGDDGVGIALQDQQAIFDPFSHTASSLAHSGKTGLGLGLSLAQRLVQLHGGTIEVYSEGKGHGSEFTVRLPRAAASAETAVQASQPQPAAASARILLVEDNADVSDALSTLLKALGHEVEVIAKGEPAPEQAVNFRPDVAFIDIGLPDIDGYEVARRIRAQAGSRAPLLVGLSGYGRPQAPGDDLGPFDDYLLKPLSMERISEVLARLQD